MNHRDEALQPIIQLIEKKIGIKPNSISLLIWEWVLKERMNFCGLHNYQDYLKKLQTSSYEVQELIELIIVPETWFFRDKEGFDFLAYFIHQYWLQQPHKNKLRILSLPCSSGEESYSISMTLLEAGIDANDFIIDALDISKKALTKGQLGVYSKNSFRGKNLSYQASYFERTKDKYRIKPVLRNSIHFYYYNILDKLLPCEPHSYHFIFCRNLLIYLNDQAQQQTFETIKKILIPSGFLIVGPAETQITQNAGFISLPFPKAYAFQIEEKGNMNQSFIQSRTAMNLFKVNKSTPVNSKVLVEQDPFIKHPFLQIEDKNILMQEAIKLADQGFFEKAIHVCARYINKFGPHAHIYYLLGIIDQACGRDEEAQEYFHKAVYLEPSHYEALIYLSLLYEKKGELYKAELFRIRAKKIYKNLN